MSFRYKPLFNIKIPLYSLLVVLMLSSIFVFTSRASADTVSQAFTSDIQLTQGSVVSLRPNSQTIVELSNVTNNESLLGVVVAPQNVLVNLNTADGNTQVVSNGQASILASDINGEVKNGDLLTASPIAGVAMKATTSTRIVGTAQEDFSQAKQKRPQTIKDKDGRDTTVNVGVLAANIAIGSYSPPNSLDNNSLVSGVQSFAISTTGKPVSVVRAVIAILVLLIAAGVSVVILYTSLTSSIRSIGRNPLSKHAILQSLIQVIVAVVAIMLSGFAIVYLILTR